MKVYYRRLTTYQKYPNQDLIDTDLVHFSKSTKRFSDSVFATCEPSLNVKGRLTIVAKALGVSVTKIELIKH